MDAEEKKERGETVQRVRLLVEASLGETKQSTETLQLKAALKTRDPRSSTSFLTFRLYGRPGRPSLARGQHRCSTLVGRPPSPT